MSRRDDLEKLIRNSQRRLQTLKQKQALKGINSEAELDIEIEDLEERIEELQAELDQLEGKQYPNRTNVNQAANIRNNISQDENIMKKRLPRELIRVLKRYIDKHYLEYPLEISINKFAAALGQNGGVNVEEAKGYLTAFFDLLSVIGAARFKNSGVIELKDEIHAATARAVCLALLEEAPSLFDFNDSEDIENYNYGSWFLYRLEKRREDHNQRREVSRLCEHVVIIVKAKFESGKEAILFQGEGNRAWGNYKLIGGRMRAEDYEDPMRTARRELRQEVRTKTASASKIVVTPFPTGPHEYTSLSKRLGAYTRYRTSVYQCTLRLPKECQERSFFGEKGRETTWFPISEVTPENEELSQEDILAWILRNGWLEEANLSTDQLIKES